ncbi:DENN domain-containing protein Crag isoform X2 [Diorhabda sublineata]|uniref:DENN domain-containing protein Crag isoform X2 n=1 Tax=Diorhabda sublineata TaxID=1163346 RepID=UPI0024E066B4|nr:DENN domain-containing protein Crag isoform X2 [Diorhabda sublineata]
MDDRRVADYFVVAGLPENPESLDETTLSEGGNLKASHGQPPITDISVIFPSLGETKPDDYEVITKTPTGLSADLNHGSLRTIECFLCIRRGRDKPPLVDIGVMYEGKELLMEDAEVVKKSVGGNIANVNNSTSQTFITYRRGPKSMPCNALVVTDVCVVIASKGESPPHAFCCINKNLNKGIVGSDVFLCYKKSMNRATLLTYKPEVLSRYPIVDLQDFPFPSSVHLFCLPMGATLELWPKEATQPKPVFSTFVLTVSDAKHKVYGSAVTFYERFPENKLTQQQKELLNYTEDYDGLIQVNKSICVLSHWPFSEDFEVWLRWLHGIGTSGEPQAIPVERYITQLLDEVPFPSPRILLQMSPQNNKDRVILTQPEDLPLPRSAASFKQLLINLGPENCLQVLLLMLTEQKVLIHSLRPDTLTSVAEAVSTMFFPFKWQCPYIPLCPLGLVEVLHAPLPFLIGVDSRFFDLYDPPPDVSCIDLDTNIITVAETQRQNLNIKLLPKKASKILKSTLDYLHYQLRNNAANNTSDINNPDDIELEFQRRKKQQAQELEIQEAFLKFMVLSLKGYRSYLLPITKAPTVGTTDPEALFQLSDFLKSRDKTNHRFFNLVMKTQMFIRFIEERSFVADGDQGLAFFDDCIEKIGHEENNSRLIEYDSVHKSDRTVFVLPPEPTVPGTEIYKYTHFNLKAELLIGLGKKKNPLSSLFQTITPGSPMARRTKQEIKLAQKLARKCVRSPDLWAACLCGTCHTLYFMILPSMLHLNVGKEKAILQQSYELLVRATKLRFACDEVCYRLMMQLCGEHSRPLLAVKLLVLMKKFGIQPNALTYGLYNRCVLEAEWPAHSSSSQLLWNKLRNVVMGAAHFRWAGRKKSSRNMSASTEGANSLLDQADRTISRSSLDSHEAIKEDHPPPLKRGTSIIKGSLNGLEEVDALETINGDEEEENNLTLVENQNFEEGDLECTEVEHRENNIPTPDSPSEHRLLSRSESAADANLIDQVQINNKKSCSKVLQFNNGTDEKEEPEERENGKTSPGKVCREVITENDPLGAFTLPPEEITVTQPSQTTESQIRNSNLSVEPVLFRSSVQRSATFEGSPPSQNKLHRSETVPAATVASSLASFGSSLKLGFSRYSPSRLSLRKADLKMSQHFIENAINNFSPSSLTSKKSNELIQGGLSSIKSAATTMVKKMEEIKEAISTSTNSTPVKVLTSDGLGGRDAVESGEGDSNDGSDYGDRHRKISTEMNSYRGSVTNLKEYDEGLPDSLFPVPKEDNSECEVDISLTTCSQCHNCSCLLYDEEIMANWSSEDSNLNTLCQNCNKPTVPFLTVSITGPDIEPCDPFSIPYLNPLVLRKELENIITQEGDLCLSDSRFVDEHPIIYWNLIWVFERINVQTHLPNLFLRNKACSNRGSSSKLNTDNCDRLGNGGTTSMEPVEEGTDPLTQELTALAQMAAQVRLRCFWDEPGLHTEGPPMYILWKMRDTLQFNSNGKSLITKTFMQQVINFIRVSDLAEPVRTLSKDRKDEVNPKCNSIYRDILFLACKVLGRDQIDINTFDKEYAAAYSRATERQNKLYSQDKPISLSALYCRQYFRPLTLP